MARIYRRGFTLVELLTCMGLVLFLSCVLCGVCVRCYRVCVSVARQRAAATAKVFNALGGG